MEEWKPMLLKDAPRHATWMDRPDCIGVMIVEVNGVITNVIVKQIPPKQETTHASS